MKNLEDKIIPDDREADQADDQESQKDIHSNGLSDQIDQPAENNADEDMLKEAYRSSESSFTLGLD